MSKKELTIPFCLREIANNMEKDGTFGMRIGMSRLDFVDVALDENSGRNSYEVIDWHGNRFFFSDLMEAICKFIAANL